MSSAAFGEIIEKWKAMHRFAGATAQEAENTVKALNEHVAVVPPAAIERHLQASGFSQPVEFFQSLLIHAWYSRKS
jgi:tRNA (cmo5U34)-methyltransferase